MSDLILKGLEPIDDSKASEQLADLELFANVSKKVEPHVHDSFCLNYGKCSE